MTGKIDQAEWGLSHWVDKFLDRAMLGDCWYTAIEGGVWTQSKDPAVQMNAAAKRRARGIKPHHLDWYVWQRTTGLYVQFELKVENRPLRPGQRATIALLTRNNICSAVCQTVPEVSDFLADVGFELHGNHRNIALELHEHYLAKRRKAAA